MQQRQHEAPFTPQDMFHILEVFVNLCNSVDTNTLRLQHSQDGPNAKLKTPSFPHFGLLVTQIACQKASIALLSDYNQFISL